MTSHDACTSGTSRVLTVASLQQLKMEALIPAPANCELRSTIKIFNAQSIGTDTRPQSKAPRVSIDISAADHDDCNDFQDRIITVDVTCVAHITPETKQQSMHWRYIGSLCKTKCWRRKWCAQYSGTCWFQFQVANFYDIEIQKLVPQYKKCLNSWSEYDEK